MLCVVLNDDPVHVVGVTLWVLDEFQGEVVPRPEHKNLGHLSLHDTGPIDTVRDAW